MATTVSKWSVRRARVWLQLAALCAACSPVAEVAAQTITEPGQPTQHTYREVDGAALTAYVFAPETTDSSTPRPAILLFHGGGWVAGAPEWTFSSARGYAAMGLVAVSIQYRLSDERVTPIDALADVCSAFHWVRTHATALGVHPHRIAASGISAGGHLAAAAATIGCGNTEGAFGLGGPDALVLWSPALDVSADGHFRRLLRDRATAGEYSPVEHVRPRMPPIHIVQGERDTLTPLSGARSFCGRVLAGRGTCELLVYLGVGHLLTRNLANQEGDFDPDPVAREDGHSRQRAFIAALWPR